MDIKTTTRVIKYKEQELADLNPSAPIKDVVRMHATQIPALATAEVEGPTLVDGKQIYTIATRLGTKG